MCYTNKLDTDLKKYDLVTFPPSRGIWPMNNSNSAGDLSLGVPNRGLHWDSNLAGAGGINFAEGGSGRLKEKTAGSAVLPGV